MSLIAKQLIMNNLNLPKEIIDIVKDYTFHKIKKIPENDERYEILLTIPIKEYDNTDNSVFVYLPISDEKDYFLVYFNYRIELQTFVYKGDYEVHFVEGTIFSIE
jgi:hypothetical protein